MDFGAIVSMFLTHLLSIVVSAAVPVLVMALYKAAMPFVKRLNMVIEQNHLEIARDIILVGISAAEQKWLGDGKGAQKKAWVLSTVQEYLESRGIDIPVAQIEAEIEDSIHRGLQEAQAQDDEEARKPLGFSTDARSVGAVSTDDEDFELEFGDE